MGNSKIQLASGETLLDLTADTITAAGLLKTMTAHGADGEPITGTLADGLTEAKTGTFSTAKENCIGHVIDIGFVPRIFFFYITSTGVVPSGYVRVVCGELESGIKTSSGTTLSSSYRTQVAYTGSSGKAVLTVTTPVYREYQSGAVKGVQMTGTDTTYFLEGSYRYYAFA